jgi:hypothetical protein
MSSKKCCSGDSCKKDVSAQNVDVVYESKEVKLCKPCNSLILLELLTEQERMGTRLHLQNNKPSAEYQAFVLSAGPNFDPSIWGFNVGDRVLVSGGGVPVPNYNNSERDKVIMEPHSIKGVLLS